MKSNRPWPQAVQTLMLTVPSLAGMALALWGLLERQRTTLLLPCAVTAGALVICLLVRRFHPPLGWLPAGIAALAAFVIGTPAAVLRGGAAVVNYCISWWNLAREAGAPLLSVNATTGDLTRFLMVLLLLAAAMLWQLAQRRSLLGAVLFSMAWIVLMVAIHRVSAIACAMLLADLLGMWLVRLDPDYSRLRTGWFHGLLLFFILISIPLNNVQPLTAITSLRTAAAAEVHRLRYGSDDLPDGDLYNAHAMLTGNEATLTVTTQLEKPIYLRGYTAGRYQNGVWSPLPGSDFGGDNAGMLKWLGQQGFDPLSQYDAYLTAAADTHTGSTVTVDNVGADRSRLYLPYSAAMDDSPDARQDSWYTGGGILGSRYYTFDDVSGTLPGELLQQPSWVILPQTDDQSAYLRTESVYRSFVYDHYLTVDPGLSQLISDTFWPDGTEVNGIYDAAQRIRNVLKDNAFYDTAPMAVPENADPIRWFLTEGEGNSALYAATAVEAFRACGIPARYAEGYLLTASEAAAGTVTLTDQDGHAWPEVYLDGLGWVPVDVTPGFYLDTYDLQQMVEHPQPVRQSAAADDSEDTAREEPDDKSANASESDHTPVAQTTAGTLLLLLVFIVAAAVILEVRRWYLLYRSHRLLTNSQATRRQRFLCRQIAAVLALLGLECRPGWHDQETDDQLRQKLPGLRPGEYRRVAELLGQSAYSGAPLSAAEERTLLTFLHRIWQERRSLSFPTRFKLHFQLYPRAKKTEP